MAGSTIQEYIKYRKYKKKHKLYTDKKSQCWSWESIKGINRGEFIIRPVLRGGGYWG